DQPLHPRAAAVREPEPRPRPVRGTRTTASQVRPPDSRGSGQPSTPDGINGAVTEQRHRPAGPRAQQPLDRHLLPGIIAGHQRATRVATMAAEAVLLRAERTPPCALGDQHVGRCQVGVETAANWEYSRRRVTTLRRSPEKEHAPYGPPRATTPGVPFSALLTNRWVIGEVFGHDDRCG